MSTRRILIVDEDAGWRGVTQMQLENEGYAVMVAASGEEAKSTLAGNPQDLVLTDLRLPKISGIELLKYIRSEFPDTAVLLITAFGDIETAVEAMKSGARDYLTKPVNPDSLRLAVTRSLEQLSLRDEVRILHRALDRRPGIVGRAGGRGYELDLPPRAAQSDVTVLIQGEAGTGKELLAHAIHCGSKRQDRPFVRISCGAIPKTRLETELFGNTTGKIEAAEGGTVFLDEVGELAPELQIRLLQLVQEHKIRRVGERRRTRVNVRIIAATQRNLLSMVSDGRFREDLYYRLNAVSVELAPLRERAEDIPALVEHFFQTAREKHNRPGLKLPVALFRYFSGYRWPGNIRELENVVDRLVTLASGEEITFKDLPEGLRKQQATLDAVEMKLPPNGISLETVEKELITQALNRFRGNQSQAARYLDLSRKTFIYRMEKYGLRGGPAAAAVSPTG